MHRFKSTTSYRPCDLQGINAPSVDKAEWFILTCLNQAGSSGYLEPDFLRHKDQDILIGLY